MYGSKFLADDRLTAAGADRGELRIALELEPPALVVGQVPMEGVELVAAEEVDVPLDERDVEEVPADVEVHASVGKSRRVADLDPRAPCRPGRRGAVGGRSGARRRDRSRSAPRRPRRRAGSRSGTPRRRGGNRGTEPERESGVGRGGGGRAPAELCLRSGRRIRLAAAGARAAFFASTRIVWARVTAPESWTMARGQGMSGRGDCATATEGKQQQRQGWNQAWTQRDTCFGMGHEPRVKRWGAARSRASASALMLRGSAPPARTETPCAGSRS